MRVEQYNGFGMSHNANYFCQGEKWALQINLFTSHSNGSYNFIYQLA